MIYHLDDPAGWQPVLRRWRQEGKTVVSTNGAFDILHVGHAHLLHTARQQGDVLIVGLNSDASVRTYKSPLRPIVPQQERAQLLAALRDVAMVMLFDEPDNLRFVDAVQPHVHVKDASYGHDLIERPTVEKHGGKIYLVEKDCHSTTNIIEKILRVYGHDKPAF